MKKILILTLLMAAFISARAQFSAGIHDSRYVYGAYRIVDNLSVRLEHSLYAEKLGFQRISAGLDYYHNLPAGFRWNAGISAGTTWNGNYQVVSGLLGLGYSYRRLTVKGAVAPHYDSGLGYTTCWGAGAAVRIIKPISIIAYYSTIPLYRMSERRLAGGFQFKVSQLTVRPVISMNVDKGTAYKNIRVLMSMNYNF